MRESLPARAVRRAPGATGAAAGCPPGPGQVGAVRCGARCRSATSRRPLEGRGSTAIWGAGAGAASASRWLLPGLAKALPGLHRQRPSSPSCCLFPQSRWAAPSGHRQHPACPACEPPRFSSQLGLGIEVRINRGGKHKGFERPPFPHEQPCLSCTHTLKPQDASDSGQEGAMCPSVSCSKRTHNHAMAAQAGQLVPYVTARSC